MRPYSFLSIYTNDELIAGDAAVPLPCLTPDLVSENELVSDAALKRHCQIASAVEALLPFKLWLARTFCKRLPLSSHRERSHVQWT